MTKARIYRPDKSAMQSGKASMKQWILEFAPEKPYTVDNLMGWVGMTDMPQEVRLRFPTQAAAIAHANKLGIAYETTTPNPRRLVHKAYADNFKFNKISG
jgi:hypothetical protein